MAININYIGHSAFFVKSKNSGILIDPFITGNPKAICKFKKEDITHIFVTHGHGDHLGDAIPISKATKTPIFAIFELANYCMQKGAVSNGVNIGGKLELPFGCARFLPAFHSSSTPDGIYAGMPASVLLDVDGIKIYHAGDTCLNSEMKTVGEIYKPDIAILPVGSCYTMDVEDAVVAAKWLGVKKVIPMHYNTFDAIKVDVAKMPEAFESQNIECIILNSGESIELQ